MNDGNTIADASAILTLLKQEPFAMSTLGGSLGNNQRGEFI